MSPAHVSISSFSICVPLFYFIAWLHWLAHPVPKRNDKTEHLCTFPVREEGSIRSWVIGSAGFCVTVTGPTSSFRSFRLLVSCEEFLSWMGLGSYHVLSLHLFEMIVHFPHLFCGVLTYRDWFFRVETSLLHGAELNLLLFHWGFWLVCSWEMLRFNSFS